MRKILFLVLALTISFGLGTGYAAINGSAHDMPDWSGGTEEGNGACSFCHIPHGAQGAKLFPAPAATNYPAGMSWTDAISMMCYDCHMAKATTFPQAQNINPFNNNAHQMVISKLGETGGWGDLSDAEVTDLGNNVYGVLAGNIQCVSCHNIHDNSTRPFLRDNAGAPDVLGASANNLSLAAGELGTLCDDCHIRRFYTGARDNHPVRTIYSSSNGRAAISAFTSIPARYQVRMSDLTLISPMPAGVDQTGEHWNLGGKADWSAGAAEAEYFACESCHTVHMNEVPEGTGNGYDEAAAGDGDTAVGTFVPPAGGQLLLVESPAPSGATPAAICLDCHMVASPQGPGTSGYSHAWATTFTSGFVTVPGNDETGLGLGNLTCQDCHDIHFSRLNAGNTPAGSRTFTLVENACTDCHTTSNALDNHHPVGTVVAQQLEGGLGGPVVTEGYDWTTADVPNDSITAGTTLGDYYFGISGNEMTCVTCHGGGNSFAHNNVGSFPGLVGFNDESQMCVDCHGVNPSDNSLIAGGLGSHYVGSIIDVSYWWEGGTNTPLADTTGAQSFAQSSADGPNNSIICGSCHTLKVDGRNSHQVTYQDADNTTNSGAEGHDWGAAGEAALLLTAAGNSNVATSAEDYLCSACHGTSPGGGTTHPVVHNTMAASTTTVAGAAGGAGDFVSLTPGAFVNCESCHRPHDADTEGGTLILEVAGTMSGGAVDETVLCAACHTDKW